MAIGFRELAAECLHSEASVGLNSQIGLHRRLLLKRMFDRSAAGASDMLSIVVTADTLHSQISRVYG